MSLQTEPAREKLWIGGEELMQQVGFVKRYVLGNDNQYRSYKYHTILPLQKEALASLLQRAQQQMKCNATKELLLKPEEVRAYVVSKKGKTEQLRLTKADDEEILGEGSNGLVIAGQEYCTGAPQAIKLGLKHGYLQTSFINIEKLHNELRAQATVLQQAYPEAYQQKNGVLRQKPCLLMDCPLLLAGGTELHMRRYDPIDWATLTTSQRFNTMRDITIAMLLLHKAGFFYTDLKPAHVMQGREGRCVLVDLDNVISFNEVPPIKVTRTNLFTDPHTDQVRLHLHYFLEVMAAAELHELEILIDEVINPINKSLAISLKTLLDNCEGKKELFQKSCQQIIYTHLRECLQQMHYHCLFTTLLFFAVPELSDRTKEQYKPYRVLLESPSGTSCAKTTLGYYWPELFTDVVMKSPSYKALPEPLQVALFGFVYDGKPLHEQAKALLALLADYGVR